MKGSRNVRMLALVLAWGCASRSAEPTRAEPTPLLLAPSPSPPSPLPPRAAAVEGAPPTLLVTDPGTLAALERRGLALAALFGGEANDNRALAALPRFGPLVTELTREVGRAAAADPQAGVDVARFSHRLFDARFLRTDSARFTLVGVVNRPDRAPFARDSCGETRLVYRLEYALGGERASRLPMTLGVELTVPRGAEGCRDAAARWVEPPTETPDARAAWLCSEAGPLAPALTRLEQDRVRVVVNLQVVRWPSTVRPDLGGHAEYLLRAFRPNEDGVLATESLENTLEPAALRDPSKRAELSRWLTEAAARIDEGTPLLPAALQAKRAVSVTPRGLKRLANRPFSQGLSARELAPSPGRFVRSGAALVRRLDELSCPGCHQARSVAGFHLLGEDPPGAPDENALALPASPHVLADLPRRLRVAKQLLAGEAPEFAAPFAERAGDVGRYGDACGLGLDPSFAEWTCERGLRCSPIEANAGDPVGQCLPAAPSVGDACEKGGVTQAPNRLRDRMGRVEAQSCSDLVCNRSRVGFPGGMCTAGCGEPGSTCGAIAVLDPFNACLARGESFLTCIRGNVRPAGLRACGAEAPCRDDYVCAKAASPAGGGACLPPYFVFQLRVDGHSSGFR